MTSAIIGNPFNSFCCSLRIEQDYFLLLKYKSFFSDNVLIWIKKQNIIFRYVLAKSFKQLEKIIKYSKN